MKIIGALFQRLRTTDAHTRELIGGALTAFLIRALASAMALFFSVLLARRFSPAGYGTFSLALSVATIAGIVARLGLDQAQLRFVSAGYQTGDWDAIKGVHTIAIRTILVSSAIMTVLMWLIAPVLAADMFEKPDIERSLRTMSLTIVPSALILYYGEALRSIRKIALSVLVQALALPTVSLMIIGTMANDLDEAVLLYLPCVCSIAFLSAACWKAMMPMLRTACGTFPVRKLLSTGATFYSVALMEIATMYGATILLGIWVTNREVGIYSAASKTALLASFVLQAVNTIAAPKFAALWQQGDRAAFQKMALHTKRISSVATLPLVAAFVLVPGLVMSLYGKDFVPGAKVLTILALGQFVNAATGPVGYMLIMSGHESIFRRIMAASAALNLIVSLTAIPRFGMTGAALAGALSLGLQNIACVIAVKRVLRIDMYDRMIV